MQPNGRVNFFGVSVLLCLVLAILLPQAYARPSRINSRQKRLSDQRLAELETLLGLAQLKGMIVTVPVAFGQVDPARVGRRRRRSMDEPEMVKILRLLKINNEDPVNKNFYKQLALSRTELVDRQGDYRMNDMI
ncbi:uncharacterized protein [Prorops nasuta]|uniref:uncharacterized protein n=1 Tax=Prorops nasuta TaxID=863751 RepID=UPI0034D01926